MGYSVVLCLTDESVVLLSRKKSEFLVAKTTYRRAGKVRLLTKSFGYRYASGKAFFAVVRQQNQQSARRQQHSVKTPHDVSSGAALYSCIKTKFHGYDSVESVYDFINYASITSRTSRVSFSSTERNNIIMLHRA